MPPKLDPRLTPARPDLAAAHLKGQVEALERALTRIPSRPPPDASGALLASAAATRTSISSLAGP